LSSRNAGRRSSLCTTIIKFLLLSTLTESHVLRMGHGEVQLVDEVSEFIEVNYALNNTWPRPWTNGIPGRDGRRRAASAFQPLRIHVEYQRTGIDTDTREHLTIMMEAATHYLMDRMNVIRVQGNLKIQCESSSCSYSCGGFNVPWEHKTTGIPNADVVIYAMADRNRGLCGNGVVAYAGTCFRDKDKGRPIAGYLNFCNLYRDARKFRQDVEVALHEVSHSLFFSSNHYAWFRDENGRRRYESGTRRVVGQRSYIMTPKVMQWTQDHFGIRKGSCSGFYGAELENQGGGATAGSHWEASRFFDEVLTGYTDGSARVFSGLNLALMEDSGWYEASWGREGTMKWGKDKGCLFVTGACLHRNAGQATYSRFPDHFCVNGNRGCTHFNKGVGKCNKSKQNKAIPRAYQYFNDPKMGGDEFANYCPIMKPERDINEETSMCNDQTDMWLVEMIDYGSQHGPDSRCVLGGIKRPKAQVQSSDASQCYKHECIGTAPNWTGVKIHMHGKFVTCHYGQSGQRKTLSGYTGFILCPRVEHVCPREEAQPLICHNGDWKAKVVASPEGYCECHPGYSGDLCEKRFQRPHAQGCHHEDADLTIWHNSITTAGHAKIVKTVGGMGPTRGNNVKNKWLWWSGKRTCSGNTRNREDCAGAGEQTRFGCNNWGDIVRNKIVVVWDGAECGYRDKVMKAQRAGAVAVVIVGGANFNHPVLQQFRDVTIPVRLAGQAFGMWLETLGNDRRVQGQILCPEMSTMVNPPGTRIPVTGSSPVPRPTPVATPTPRPVQRPVQRPTPRPVQWPTPKPTVARPSPTPRPVQGPPLTCGPLYPTNPNGSPRASSVNQMFFALNSMGATFTPLFTVRLKSVRFVAKLAENSVGKFSIYTLVEHTCPPKDSADEPCYKPVSVVKSQPFQAKGSMTVGSLDSMKYYEASFSDVQTLQRGRRYGISVFMDSLTFSEGHQRSTYQALMFVDSGFNTDWASNVKLGKTSQDILPNILNNMAPMLEVCRE